MKYLVSWTYVVESGTPTHAAQQAFDALQSGGAEVFTVEPMPKNTEVVRLDERACEWCDKKIAYAGEGVWAEAGLIPAGLALYCSGDEDGTRHEPAADSAQRVAVVRSPQT